MYCNYAVEPRLQTDDQTCEQYSRYIITIRNKADFDKNLSGFSLAFEGDCWYFVCVCVLNGICSNEHFPMWSFCATGYLILPTIYHNYLE